MKLEWMLLAEGFGTAANGAVTVIGINQQVVIAPGLPVTTKRGILAHFSDSDSTLAGQELEVTFSLTGPKGNTLLTQTAPARISANPTWPELPSGVDVFLEIPLRLPEYGTYDISLSLKPPGEEPVNGHVSFFVMENPPTTMNA